MPRRRISDKRAPVARRLKQPSDKKFKFFTMRQLRVAKRYVEEVICSFCNDFHCNPNFFTIEFRGYELSVGDAGHGGHIYLKDGEWIQSSHSSQKKDVIIAKTQKRKRKRFLTNKQFWQGYQEAKRVIETIKHFSWTPKPESFKIRFGFNPHSKEYWMLVNPEIPYITRQDIKFGVMRILKEGKWAPV